MTFCGELLAEPVDIQAGSIAIRNQPLVLLPANSRNKTVSAFGQCCDPCLRLAGAFTNSIVIG